MIEIGFAYILDLIFGDPHWLPHPVKGMGWLIKKLELPLKRLLKHERFAGIILALSVIGIVWCSSSFIIRQAVTFNRYLGSAISVLLIYASLAIKDLGVESLRVWRALKKGDLSCAGKNLSLIVGRDTENLDQQEMVRATVETVSENSVDGIISPLFYAFIGGAPLALAYKAINTLDSLLGYKNERYKNFGWASAKLDDWANFIPARISCLFLPLASWLLGQDGKNACRIIRRDGQKNPSPNSGLPQAAMAGALGIQLGGLNFYNALPDLKPLIGDGINSLKPGHIRESIKTTYLCSALFLVSGLFLIWVIGRG